MYNKLTFASAEKVRDSIIDSQKIEIANLYKEWANELGKKAKIYKHKTTPSSWVTENNARQLKKQLEEQSKRVTEEVMLGIKNNMYIISDAVVKDAVKWAKQFGFDEAAISKAYSSVPDYAIRNLITGNVYDTSWSLSQRIWSSNEQNMKQVYQIVAGGLAQNKSIYEICKDLSKYVEPGARKPWNLIAPDGKKIYPRQVDYNAQRLARTLAQHTYQQSFVAVTQNNPFILSYKWIANGSRVCEICADRDGQIFDKGSLPLDHPNGMCVMEPVEDKDIENKLVDWFNNEDGVYPEIDKFAKEFGYNAKKPSESAINTRMSQLINKYGNSSAKTHTAWLGKLNNNEKLAVKEFKNTLGMKWNAFYNKYVYKEKIPKVSQIKQAVKATTKKVKQFTKMTMEELKELSLKSPFNVMKGRVTVTQQEVYSNYVGTGNSFRINRMLRENPHKEWYELANISSSKAQTVKAVDEVIAATQTERDIVFNRFVDDGFLKNTFGGDDIASITNAIGSVYENNQFMSVTIESNPYFVDRPALLRVQAEEGTNAFFTTNYKEGEVILGRDTKYIVEKVIDHKNDPIRLEMNDKVDNYRGIEIFIRMLK